MADTELVLPSDQQAQARRDRVTQTTQVEQSRAVAEVQGAIVVAQKCRRDKALAVQMMEEECAEPHLAERAFFRFPRAGASVAGASIHLARTLARCWGNIQYGITELRRDDEQRISEMQAWAWDVETNVRSASTFVVPHTRDTKRGPVELTDTRDVYENNANQGARRVREAIFSVLPAWYVARAQEICQRTIEDGGGIPLPQRIANAIGAFDKLGVTVDQLEVRVGRQKDRWTPNDLAQLSVIHSSIKQGTVTVDEEFPPRDEAITVDEIAKPKRGAKSEQLDGGG